jgi:hypothetical protein
MNQGPQAMGQSEIPFRETDGFPRSRVNVGLLVGMAGAG